MTSANSYHLDEALAMPGVCVYIYIYKAIKINFLKIKKQYSLIFSQLNIKG
jgi:hypothetical protein